MVNFGVFWSLFLTFLTIFAQKRHVQQMLHKNLATCVSNGQMCIGQKSTFAKWCFLVLTFSHFFKDSILAAYIFCEKIDKNGQK